MVFSSVLFLFIYLPLTLAVYFCTPLKFRNLFLLIVNLIFYGWGEPVYIVIMFVSIFIDYYNGKKVAQYLNEDRAKAKRFMIISVILNLSILGFFKYYDFIVVNLASLGFTALEPMGIALPIGISFYTFQTMSYTIDIYRGDAMAQPKITDFGTYVTLFPQLIAGPIVRYKDVAEQLADRTETVDEFSLGIDRFMVGLGKKVIFANGIGLLWDTINAMSIGSMSTLGAWLGIIAFGLQIYFDFSGYSDMAIGLGHMFGFTFLENFNYPYISRSITEFWRRWHISLGTWFREYVYIPLGGNRKGPARQIVNLLIVWGLTGLWHGASWNFILWGFYFGIILIIEKLFLLKWLKKAPMLLQHTYALILIALGWALFANESLARLGDYLQVMVGLQGSGIVDPQSLYLLANYALLIGVALFAATPVPSRLWNTHIKGKKWEWAKPILIVLLLLVCTAYIVDASYNPFLYFRF
ncbi:MAG: MBOAT family O-acyltransferase [Erysipelotrichaceae bacterium]